jgi:hypothetical protein
MQGKVCMNGWNAIKFFELDVTWHETAGAYMVRFEGTPRGVANMKAAVLDHDAHGRTYHVFAHDTAGARYELNGAAVARLGA